MDNENGKNCVMIIRGWIPSPFIRDEYSGNGYGGFHSWPKVDSLGDRLIGLCAHRGRSGEPRSRRPFTLRS